MKEFSATIIDPIGLHARPASELVKLASGFKSDIKLIFNDKEVNAKSIMNIMSLGVKTNNVIIIRAIGDDEDAAISRIKDELTKLNLIN